MLLLLLLACPPLKNAESSKESSPIPDCDTVFYADGDGDGAGDAGVSDVGCEPPTGYVDNAADCDDTNEDVAPDAAEVCDFLDNDCDGAVDEDTPPELFFGDADGDGYGDPSRYEFYCELPTDAVENADDCDDGDPDISPGAAEVCDNVDNNCDGLSDDDDPALDSSTAGRWYADADGDGYGDPSSETLACAQPAGTVADATDCQDTDGALSPGATEVCDGQDNDCDGLSDDDDPSLDRDTTTAWYADDDGDGYGDPARLTLSCAASGVTDATDCDDGAASVAPGATEQCDGVDQDCDGSIDEDAVDPSVWYPDFDGDGAGDGARPLAACDAPTDYVATDTDCDDSNSAVGPGATEVCDGQDNDCNGATDEVDADGDGYGACDDDCDDTDSRISPREDEVCEDGVDNDCDGAADACRFAGALAGSDALIRGVNDGDNVGAQFVGLGDFDDDGDDDLAVGLPYASEGELYGGTVVIMSGPFAGTRSTDDADARIVGDQTYGYMGMGLDGGGDFDADGTPDLVAGAYASSYGAAYAGDVYLFTGGALADRTPEDAAARIYATTTYQYLGQNVHFAGDMDADGYDDVLAAGQGSVDVVWLIAGTTRGVAEVDSVGLRLTNDTGDGTGRAAAGVGDIDGDGYDDALIGAYYASHTATSKDASDAGSTVDYGGAAYLLYGPITGDVALSTGADAVFYGSGDYHYLGIGVAGLPDTNGDGYRDLALSTYNSDVCERYAGGVHVFYGPPTRLVQRDTDADAVRCGPESYAYAYSLGAQADLDADGYGDLVVGASYAGDSDEGAMAVAYGPLSGASTLGDIMAEGTTSYGYAGTTVGVVGDLDGNGWLDLGMGTPSDRFGGVSSGAIYLYFGSGL